MQADDMADGQTAQMSRSAVSGVFYLTGVFFLGFLGRLLLGPLMPVVEEDLSFSHTEAGTIFFCISFGYTAMLLFSGLISYRLDHRRTILCSCGGIICAMLIMSNAHSLNILRGGAFVAGMAAGLYFSSGMATLTSLVPRHKVGWALGIHEMAPNMSFILAPLIAEALLSFTTWRVAPLLMAGLTVIMTFVYLRSGPGRDFRGQALKARLLREVVSDPTLWGATLVLSLAVATSLGTFSMLPLYLVFEQGVDRTTVNMILPLSRVLCLGPAFAAGIVSDRIGAMKALAMFLGLTGFATFMLGLASGNWLWFMVFAQPLVTVCLFAPAFSFLTLGFAPQARNVAVSVATGCSIVVGTGLFPIGIGYMGEMGRFGLAFMSMGVMCLAALPVLAWLNKKQP